MLTFVDKVFSFMSLTLDMVRRWKIVMPIIRYSVMNKESINRGART